MSDDSWMMSSSEAVTIIEFESVVDGLIAADGHTASEVLAEVCLAIEAAASEVATKVGATVTEVKWNISRRRRT